MVETSKQVHDYVLCFDCEQLLNVSGEQWILGRLAVGLASPLYYALGGLEPIHRETDLDVYSVVGNPEFEVEKIVHFAVGVFYKAAVHRWRIDKNRWQKLNFGPYQEPLRLYLLGQRPFPTCVALTFCVLPPTNSPKRIYSPYEWTPGEHRTYSFSVIGLEFWLSIGRRISEDFRNLCFATKPFRPVVVNGHTDLIMTSRANDVIRTGGVKGKLANRSRIAKG
jgi:hypothetical protein